jgi:cytochrome b561
LQPRYSKLNQSLHWITALCMFALLPLAWVMVNAKRGPATPSLFAWHETLGAIVLLITAFRIVWRFVDGPPPYPPAVRRWEQGLARVTYWVFFAALIYMPVTGFLTAELGGHALKLFDAVPTPLLVTPDKAQDKLFTQLHLWGQWLIYVLIGLHLSAVAFHLIFRHDGVLGRMLPADAAEPAPGAPERERRPAPRPQPSYEGLRPAGGRR